MEEVRTSPRADALIEELRSTIQEVQDQLGCRSRLLWGGTQCDGRAGRRQGVSRTRRAPALASYPLDRSSNPSDSHNEASLPWSVWRAADYTC